MWQLSTEQCNFHSHYDIVPEKYILYVYVMIWKDNSSNPKNYSMCGLYYLSDFLNRVINQEMESKINSALAIENNVCCGCSLLNGI